MKLLTYWDFPTHISMVHREWVKKADGLTGAESSLGLLIIPDIQTEQWRLKKRCLNLKSKYMLLYSDGQNLV